MIPALDLELTELFETRSRTYFLRRLPAARDGA